jgi:hypothetical protein
MLDSRVGVGRGETTRMLIFYVVARPPEMDSDGKTPETSMSDVNALMTNLSRQLALHGPTTTDAAPSSAPGPAVISISYLNCYSGNGGYQYSTWESHVGNYSFSSFFGGLQRG